MSLGKFMPIFDYEDLSFRKDFGKRLYFLGLRNGKALLRLARDDELDYERLLYLRLCDEVVVKHGKIRTFRGKELARLKAKLYLAPIFRKTVYEAVSEFLEVRQ